MAARGTKLRKTGTIMIAVFAILGLPGLIGMQQVTSRLACFLGISLEIALETLPSILLRVLHLLQPCAFVHLEDLLQVSACWHFILTVTAA